MPCFRTEVGVLPFVAEGSSAEAEASDGCDAINEAMSTFWSVDEDQLYEHDTI